MSKAVKVTKVAIPEMKRSLSFGDRFGWMTLSAGIEVIFEEPVEIDSPEVKQAYEKIRKIARGELKAQYDHYKNQLDKANGKNKGGDSKK